MSTVQSRFKCFSTLFIIVICGLSQTRAGAEPNADALPNGAVARLGWSPLRIGFADFTLTPDGRTIVVVTPQGNLRRLDAKSGRLLESRQLTDRSDVNLGEDDTVHPAVLSANGETVALYESSHTGPRLTVYDVASGKMILRSTSDEKRRILSGKLSPNGKELVVIEEEDVPQDTVIPEEKISKRACLRLFDLKSGRRRELGTFPHGMLGQFFSADGKRLLVTGQDLAQTHNVYISGAPAPHILTLFDLPSGKKLWRRTVFGMNFAVSRDGKTVLASGCPNESGSLVRVFRASLNESCRVTGFHVLQMDLEAKKLDERFVPCRLEPDMQNLRGIVDFILAPDDRTLVINHFGGHDMAYIVSRDLRSGKEIWRFKLPDPEGARHVPPKMVIAADGRTLLTNREYLQRWDLTTGKSFFAPPCNGLPDYPLQLAWTPDSKEMLACSNQWLLGRWNTATGKRLDCRQDNYSGTPIVRTPSGLRDVRYVRKDKRIEFTVFDPIAQKTLHNFRWAPPKNPPIDFNVKGYSLTANGKTLLASYDKHLIAWEAATGRPLFDLAMPDKLSVASFVPRFSPCGRWTLLDANVHHVGSGTPLLDVSGKPDEWLIRGTGMRERPVWFSDDGRLMAVCYRKKEAKSAAEDAIVVWELVSGKVLARFERTGFIAQAAFAPDGCTIALLDAQGVRLMDLLDGKQRAKYPAPDVIHGSAGSGSDKQTLVFAPGGGTLATGHQDGTIMLWNVPRLHNSHPAALADDEAEKLWTDLGSSSPVTARTAVDRLTRHPDAASALLAKRFRPPPVDAKLAALLNDLDSDVFATREEASRKLREYGARAETALRGRLAKFPSLEMRRRIEGILAELAPPKLRLPLSGEQLRGVRAIEVLERTDNATARSLLKAWTEQTEDVQLAIEARMALERLGR